VHGATKKRIDDNDMGSTIFVIHFSKNVECYIDGDGPHTLIW
jgi:hypothetical protein